MTAAPWRLTVTSIDVPLAEERAAHDRTRRLLVIERARVERLRAELAAARAGTADARDAVIQAQSALLDTLQAAQWTRDTEMAEHLNTHMCTPRPAPDPLAPIRPATPPRPAFEGVRW